MYTAPGDKKTIVSSCPAGYECAVNDIAFKESYLGNATCEKIPDDPNKTETQVDLVPGDACDVNLGDKCFGTAECIAGVCVSPNNEYE